MEKLESKDHMTVVHLTSGSSKPIAPFIKNQFINKHTSDPSSSIRSDRYPIPGSFEYLSNANPREYSLF